MIIEGRVEVAGAVLQYRRAGIDKGPLLVFENGWSASHHNWAWVERQLAPHAQLLFYDRAGIGRSAATAPQSVPNISRHFIEMLQVLEIREPVIVVGHSYGGLVGALHVAQQPQAVRALIQLDASPWRDDAALDAQFRMIRGLVPLLKLFALLGLRNPLFGPACDGLPEPDGSLMEKHAMGSVASWRGASVELGLLSEIRKAIAQAPSNRPRLVISAGKANEPQSALLRKLVSSERARDTIVRMQLQHRAYAERGAGGTWESLPLDHGSFVFTEAGAAASASRILRFLSEL
jgi:pimeloyl-ACP methyl ester carboxylesterase